MESEIDAEPCCQGKQPEPREHAFERACKHRNEVGKIGTDGCCRRLRHGKAPRGAIAIHQNGFLPNHYLPNDYLPVDADPAEE